MTFIVAVHAKLSGGHLLWPFSPDPPCHTLRSHNATPLTVCAPCVLCNIFFLIYLV